LTAVEAQASWAYGFDVNFLAAGYNTPSVGSAGSGIYAGKDGPVLTVMPTAHSTHLLVANITKKTAQNSTSNTKHVSNGHNTITALPYENTFSNRVDGNDSGILMERDYLEPYETLLLNEADKVTERKLCHNELCCDFQVTMHTNRQDQNSADKHYVYRLAVFDGIRSYTFATGGIQVCAVVFCTNSSLSSCGNEFERPEQAAFFTVFDDIRISGNFRLDNSTQLPATLVHGYGVLSPDTFQFTREEIPEKREVRIDMKTKGQHSNILTFAVYGRDFLKDGGPVTKPSGTVRSNAASVSLLFSVAVFLCVRSHY
jgi:hypothetical protein